MKRGSVMQTVRHDYFCVACSEGAQVDDVSIRRDMSTVSKMAEPRG